eukprot:3286054-Amphidinium_carterae.1
MLAVVLHGSKVTWTSDVVFKIEQAQPLPMQTTSPCVPVEASKGVVDEAQKGQPWLVVIGRCSMHCQDSQREPQWIRVRVPAGIFVGIVGIETLATAEQCKNAQLWSFQ